MLVDNPESGKQVDRPVSVLLFEDEAEVPFYREAHNRAKKNMKHVYLLNDEVGFKLHPGERAILEDMALEDDDDGLFDQDDKSPSLPSSHDEGDDASESSSSDDDSESSDEVAGSDDASGSDSSEESPTF
jgi:hypothetical protein